MFWITVETSVFFQLRSYLLTYWLLMRLLMTYKQLSFEHLRRHYNLLHLSNYFNFLDYLLIQWQQKLRQTAFSKATQFGVDASFTSTMSQLLIKSEKMLNAFYLSTLLGRRNCGWGSESPPCKMYGWNSDHRKLLFGPHREGKQVS